MGRFFGPTPNIISAEGFFRGSAGSSGPPFTWTQVITGFESALAWFYCGYTNGHYWIAAENTLNTAVVITSTDLVTFTNHPILSATPYRAKGLAFGASTYVAALDSNPAFGILAYTSPDLVTWTQHNANFPATGPDQFIYPPVFGNGAFLLVSTNSPDYATSPDGATWTLQSTYVPNFWGRPIFDGTRFVAPVMGASNTPKIAVSTDGINWTESTVTLSSSFSTGTLPFFVGANSTPLYIVGENLDDVGESVNAALTSATPFTFNDPAAFHGTNSVQFGSVSWSRCNDANGDLFSSSNGTTWVQDTVAGSPTFFGSIGFGAGNFIANGGNSGGQLLVTRTD